MIETQQIDYSRLDRSEILMFLFHPRPEWEGSPPGPGSRDMLIPVEEGVLGARFHLAGPSGANILFFHGNGEIVADYDDMAPLYTRLGINFLPVDYRGYGRSTGRPTITGMMRDAHRVLDFTRRWLRENGYHGPLILMGRSLGSAPALELALHYAPDLEGLIIESGFAYTAPLMRLLGVELEDLGLGEKDGFQNIEKIRSFAKPTLIIHAEEDHIIAFSEGMALYKASGAGDKRLLSIPGANHNDIFLRGMSPYMKAIEEMAGKFSGLCRE